MTAPSTIAVIANREGLDSQALLEATATALSEAGLRVVGLTARNAASGEACSAGFLHDIASHQQFPIRLEAPPTGSACSLDASGMERACDALLDQIPSADLVVLSKFGKLEAMQQGLWPAFTMAVAAGIPLLTTVSSKHVAAWEAFAPDATSIEADRQAIAGWWRRIAGRRTGPSTEIGTPNPGLSPRRD